MIIKYSYERVPTIRKFALCDKRWRLLMGPFGCFPSSCKYLSFSDGKYQWKEIKDYKKGEKIAVYNPKTKELKFEEPLDYIVLPMKDNWIHINAHKFFNSKVSPEHTFLYNENKTKIAIEFVEHGISGAYVVNTFRIKNKNTFLNENIIRLIVMLSADGHKVNNYTWTLSLRKQRKIERVKFICDINNVKYKIRVYKNRPSEVVFTLDLSNIPELKNLTKTFPNYLYNVSSDLLDVLIEELLFWDGGNYNGNDRRYFTTIKDNAEFVQYACHATGRRAYISKVVYTNKGWKDSYVVWISKKGIRTSFIGKGSKDEAISFIPPEPGELKYCFTTSTGFFLVKDNDAIYISGNSGKSSGCVMEIIRRSLQQRPSPRDGIRYSRWAVIRSTFRKLRDTTIKTFLDWLPPSVFGQYKIATHDYIITSFPNTHIEVMFRALDRPEDVTNLLSLELTGAWINEAKEINKEIVDALDGRIGRYPSPRDGGCSWYGIIMDTNPPDEDHWIYKTFEEDRPNHCAIFKQPSGLSPDAENMLTWDEWEKLQRNEFPEDEIPGGLRPDYYIRLAEGKSQDFIDVYVHGRYGTVKEGKPIFERTFNPELHIAKNEVRPIHGLPIIIGMDFGLTPSAVFTQFTPKGRFIIFDELYEEGIGIEQFTNTILKPHIASFYSGFRFLIIGDPAGMQRSQTDEKTCFEVLREYGFEVRPSKSNAISYRINAVENFLTKLIDGLPALQIDRKCNMIIKGFMSKYCWRKKRDGTTSTEIEKNKYSHPMDALGYAATYFYKEDSQKKFYIPRRSYIPASTLAGY